MKKRFNTNIRESKLVELKKLAIDEGLGANAMIEKMIDIYKLVKENPKILELLENELAIKKLKSKDSLLK